MVEIWKVTFDSGYEVSDQGNVRRIAHARQISNRVMNYCERALHPELGTSGYLYVTFSRKKYGVHRLVATAFHPNPENKRVVNHKNLIKTDNRAINVEWATDSENQKHSWKNSSRTAYQKGMFGSKSKTAKPVLMVDDAGKTIRRFGATSEAAIEMQVNINSIAKAAREGYKIKGYYWEYE